MPTTPPRSGESCGVRPPRRTTAVTGVLSANSGHCSAIPGPVVTLWEPATPCADVPGTALATLLPTPRTPFVLPLVQNPRSALARPSDAARALTRARPPPGGPSTLYHTCLEDGTLHSNSHDAHRSYQDAGAIFARPGHRTGQLHAQCLTLQYLTVYLLQ